MTERRNDCIYYIRTSTQAQTARSVIASILIAAIVNFQPKHRLSLKAGTSISVIPTENKVPAANAVTLADAVPSMLSLAAKPITIPKEPDKENHVTSVIQSRRCPPCNNEMFAEPLANEAKPLWQAMASII
mmetsp:Transcript_48191/g.90288  ORF Transcript_48191/g.90288 Transcript_48191/m.90288 type:complete len:131 (-) Transcript_48191:184-576(-)